MKQFKAKDILQKLIDQGLLTDQEAMEKLSRVIQEELEEDAKQIIEGQELEIRAQKEIITSNIQNLGYL